MRVGIVGCGLIGRKRAAVLGADAGRVERRFAVAHTNYSPHAPQK